MTDQPDRPEVDDPRVLALAKARQKMANENPFNAGFCPPWDGLAEQEQHLSLLDARNCLRAALKAGLVASPAVPAPAPDRAALRDRIAAAVRAFPFDDFGMDDVSYALEADPDTQEWVPKLADAVLAVLPAATGQTAEEHRLDLSDALGLGTGAPWDAICDRATELALPPLDRDPVAQRLGLVAEHRAAVLNLAADFFRGLHATGTTITAQEAEQELRRMAADAGHDDRDHSCAESGCSGEPTAAPPAELTGERLHADEQVAEGRFRCPRCRENITDYAEDDHVFRTGDERPYCSGECVIAAHRAGLPTVDAQQPKEPRP